jgi:L-ascorbate metabolism protein UlaG (beta-lactamase superfamily)
MGSIVELEQDGQRLFRLYVSGDTLYRPSLAEIPRRYPDIDAMLVHLGGTRVLGVLLTMDGRQGSQLTRLIRPDVTVPIHHSDYTVFRSPLGDFLREATRHGSTTRLLPLRRGETADLPARARAV